MKKIRVLIALFLLLSMLAAISCTSGVNNNDGEKEQESDSVIETEPESYPKEDFGGYEFTILAPYNESYNFAMADFLEPSSDPYENAYYKRHEAIKEELNVELKQISALLYGELTIDTVFKDAVLANTGDYDMTVLNLIYACSATGNGYLLPIDEFEYINLEKSWWDRDCTEQLMIGEKNYMICGDIFISDKECMWILYFNKGILNQHGLENPFELVDNNEWTWDKMHEMANVAAADANGDGNMSIDDDIWGFATHDEHYAAMWQSAGLKLVTINDEGIPEFSWGTNQFADVYDELSAFLSDSEHIKVDLMSVWPSYEKNQALFASGVSADMRSQIAQYDIETGVIPNPKYSSEVDRYYSYVAQQSCVVVFGIGNKDTYRTSIIAEAMAANGQEIITPEYYDKQLKSRYSRCEDSARMLDIIFNNRCYDLGVYFNWGGCRSALSMSDVNISRTYNALGKQMNKALKESFEKLDIFT